VVLGGGEHHNAADTALDFLGNCGRMVSLRLHPHAETKKKATNGNCAASGAGRTSARLFRSRRRKGRPGLRWSDIDLKAARLTVNQSLERLKGKTTFKSPKTQGSRRTITLPALTVEALKEHRSKQGRIGAGELVYSHEGIPWDPDSLTKAFDRLIEATGEFDGSHSTVCAIPTSRIS
jgi:hypothetical protein